MTVFKTFLKILNKNKFIIILYTVFLIGFGGFNMQTSDNSTNFVASKPDIMIVNYDEEKGITKDLIKYITDNSNIIELNNNEEAINDGLFYRDVNYVIYIPENYGKDFMDGKNPEINIKSTGDYQSSFAEMLLSRYIKVANIYQKSIKNEDELTSKINETLSKQSEVEITSKLDTDSLAKATFYYNFASYSKRSSKYTSSDLQVQTERFVIRCLRASGLQGVCHNRNQSSHQHHPFPERSVASPRRGDGRRERESHTADTNP